MPQAAADPFEFHATGDALYDRYAFAVVEREKEFARLHTEYVERLIGHFRLGHLRADRAELSRSLAEAMKGINAEDTFPEQESLNRKARADFILPAEVLAGWKGEFGQDPRYWQLLYWQESSRWQAEKDLDYQKFRRERFDPLIHAWLAGFADAPTILLLNELLRLAADNYVVQQLEMQEYSAGIDEDRRAWHTEIGAEGDSTGSYGPSFDAAYYEEINRQALELCKAAGLTQEKVWEAALTADPDWAQVHYACLPAGKGDPQLTLKILEAGNHAPRNRMLRHFPQSAALDCASQGRIPGCLYLFWAIDMHCAINPYLNFILLRTQVDKAMKAAREELKLRLHREVTVMFTRLMQAESQSTQESMICAIALGKSAQGLGRRLGVNGESELAAKLEHYSGKLIAKCMDLMRQGRQDLEHQHVSLESRHAEPSKVVGFDLDIAESRMQVAYLYRDHFEAIQRDEAFRQVELLPLALVVEQLLT